MSVGPLLEFLVGKQNAGKQRTCVVSQVDMETMELENEVLRTNLAALKQGTSLLQEVGSSKRKKF